jgi:hypothetical protein
MKIIGLETFKEFSRWKELLLNIMDIKRLPGIKTHYIVLGLAHQSKISKKLFKIT